MIPGVQTPVVRAENESIFNQYTIRAERRDELAAHLKKKGIGTKVYYPLPLHLQPCFSHLELQSGGLPGVGTGGRRGDLTAYFPGAHPGAAR